MEAGLGWRVAVLVWIDDAFGVDWKHGAVERDHALLLLLAGELVYL